MTKYHVYDILILAFIVIVTVVVAGLYFGKVNVKSTSSTTPSPAAKKPAGQTVVFPISPKTPGVKNATFYYVFEGQIVQIQNAQGGTELIMNISGPNFPRFIFPANIRVISGKTKASISSLKVAQTIDIAMVYYRGPKKWMPLQITIISPLATPSATTPTNSQTTPTPAK